MLVRYENDSLTVFGTETVSGYPEEFSEQNSRYLFNVNGRSIMLREKSLEIRSGDNSIMLTDDSVTLTVGKSTIKVTDGKIEIKTGDIAAESTGKLSAKAGGDLKLQGSSITAKGSSEIAMKCNNIRLN